MGIFYGKQTDPDFKIFLQYLELHELIRVLFCYIFNEELIKQLELNQLYKFTIVRKLDKDSTYLTKQITIDNLRDFINLESYPLIMPFEDRLIQDVLRKNYSILVLAKKNGQKKSDKLQIIFENACKLLRGKIQCASMEEQSELEIHILNVMGLKVENLPEVQINNINNFFFF